MRVILKQEVAHLGEAGEIIEVRGGYGRNFLIPKGLAIPASEGSVAQLQHQHRIAEAIRRKERSRADALAERLSGLGVTIRREAGEDDRLFGSVTNRDLAEALAAEGVVIDRRIIQIEEQIKTIGLFTVPIRLHRDVTASLKVFVMRST